MSTEVAEQVVGGAANDLIDRLSAHAAFADLDTDALRDELDPALYVGRAPDQVDEFVQGPGASVLESLKPFEISDEATVQV